MRAPPRRSLCLCTALLAGCVARIGDPESALPSGQPPPDQMMMPPPGGQCVERGPPVTPRLQRLSFAQYDRTASELLGLEVSPSAELGPEVDGFTPTSWSGFQTAAEHLAAELMADPTARGRIVSCQPSGDGAACAGTIIQSLGRRAYRRALSAAEAASYLALYTDRAELTATGSFDEGIQLVLETFLQSPGFLLRVERSVQSGGAPIALSSMEVATRLSYALWNGPPDETLLAAAERGELTDKANVRREALRMLTSPEGVARARFLLRDTHKSWLGMVGAYAQFWSNTQRDPSLFPEFYPGIDVDFREEVLRFIDGVVLEQSGGFRELMTSPYAVVNDKLAPIYGLSGGFSSAWTPVSLDPSERPGLLTRAGFVGTHGRYGRGSLIFRGAFVLKRLLCQEIGSPPAGADATPLPDPSAELRTTRQRIDALTSPALCASCHHTRINPAGFALEGFDGLGRSRTEDNGERVDLTGTLVVDGKSQSFDGPKAYAELIAGSAEAHGCYVDRFAEVSFGTPVDLGCEGQRLAARLGEPGVSIKDFMVDFVSSDAFLHRSVEEAP